MRVRVSSSVCVSVSLSDENVAAGYVNICCFCVLVHLSLFILLFLFSSVFLCVSLSLLPISIPSFCFSFALSSLAPVLSAAPCRKEFVDGCRAIQADSTEGICSRFSVMMEEARGEESFKDLYRFTFQFGLDVDEGQRSLQRGIAVALWRLVFTQDMPSVLDSWLDFLSENPCAVRGISRDTWNMFLNFTQSIGSDLSNYSEDEAWPSLFDSFVEWESERRRREQEEEDKKRRGMGEEEGQGEGECPAPSLTDCSEAGAAQGWTSH